MSAPVQEGEILAGKYRVEKVLGVGGMGVVVAAMHVQLEERVALKFLLPEALQNGEAVARFLREARASVKLKGEHVARVSDVGTMENGAPYMVMEYLAGQDLARILQTRGQLPLDEAIDFFLQAGEAVAEAHGAGIIHRDLKPANFFVTNRPDGTPCLKVLDFGISKMTSGSGADMGMTKTTAVMGSPYYMSPEQMKSSRNVDTRSDLWSLGIILYELLSGRVAFGGDTLPELCANVLSNPPPRIREVRPDLPPTIEAIILRALEKDPSKRYQSIAELASDLAPFAADRSRISIDRILRMGGGTVPARGSMASIPGSMGSLPSSGVVPVQAITGPRATDPNSATAAAWDGPPRHAGKGKMALVVGVGGAVAVVAVAIAVFAFKGKPTDPVASTSATPNESAAVAPANETAPSASAAAAPPVVTPATAAPSASAAPEPPKTKVVGKTSAPPPKETTKKPPVTKPAGNDDPFGSSRH